MTTTLKPSYGASVSLACTTTSLSSDTNLLAGRQSIVADNTSDLADTVMLGGTIATTSTPTANTQIEIWLYGDVGDGTNYSGGAGATDANLSLATAGVKALMVLGQVIGQTDTTARTYDVGPINVGKAFGGDMPAKWGFFVVHNTGQTLGATTLKYTPMQYQNI
jgi:hypothetical protein